MPGKTKDTDAPRPYQWKPLEEVGSRSTGVPPKPMPPRARPATAPAGDPGTAEPPRAFLPAELVDRVWDARAVPTVDGSPDQAPSGEPSVEDAARALLEDAQKRAEQVLAEAEEQAGALLERARKEGLEAGVAEGRGRSRLAAETIEALAAELAGFKTSLYAEAKGQVVELALTLTDKILGPLAEADRGAVVRVVERALQLLSDREQLTIRVHPDDMKVLVESKPQLLQGFDGIQKLTVVEDPSVKRGGCLVQTPTTEIDARLDTQLQELARSVRGA